MRTLFFAALLTLTGCAVPTTASNDLARARRADASGRPWTALHLYRAAAHGGSVEAQIHLAGWESGRASESPVTRMVAPHPDAREKAMWAHAARATASRLAAADDPAGHLALAQMALSDESVRPVPSADVTPAAYARARRHYERAFELGSAQGAHGIAMLVLVRDGPLAAEPYVRAGYDAGYTESGRLLAFIALQRPSLERGARSRDAPGDLSHLDVVGGMRTLREVDPAAAEAQIASLRSQRSADADSLLRVLGAAGVL